MMHPQTQPITRVLRGAAVAICPRADRAWIEAMFAETSAVPEPGRWSWLLGAASVVWAAFGARLGASLPMRRRWAAFVAAHFAIGFFALGLTDIEAFVFDDDWFLAFSGVTTTALSALFGAATLRAFRGSGPRQSAA